MGVPGEKLNRPYRGTDFEIDCCSAWESGSDANVMMSGEIIERRRMVTAAETLGVPVKPPANWVLDTKTGVVPSWRMIALGTCSFLIKA